MLEQSNHSISGVDFVMRNETVEKNTKKWWKDKSGTKHFFERVTKKFNEVFLK